MDKELVLLSVEKAKKSHLAQVDKIDYLVRGITLKTIPTPLEKRDCLFGEWLYANEKLLRTLIQNELFEEIERLHGYWHEEYFRIHQIFYPPQQGLLSKIIGKNHKASDQARDRAKAYFSDMSDLTQKLIKKIDLLEKRLRAMPSSKFEQLN